MTPDFQLAGQDRLALRLQRPDVVFETFDTEAVVVHLRLGRYYSFSPEGTRLFEALARAPAGAALALDGLSTPRRAAVAGFLDRLLAEDLVARVPEPGAALDEVDLAGDADPTFEVFTDLEHLLALDPIHDLDAEGWPARSATESP